MTSLTGLLPEDLGATEGRFEGGGIRKWSERFDRSDVPETMVGEGRGRHVEREHHICDSSSISDAMLFMNGLSSLSK